jgi:hypothetical protein
VGLFKEHVVDEEYQKNAMLGIFPDSYKDEKQRSSSSLHRGHNQENICQEKQNSGKQDTESLSRPNSPEIKMYQVKIEMSFFRAMASIIGVMAASDMSNFSRYLCKTPYSFPARSHQPWPGQE